jgi:hypothetical protein
MGGDTGRASDRHNHKENPVVLVGLRTYAHQQSHHAQVGVHHSQRNGKDGLLVTTSYLVRLRELQALLEWGINVRWTIWRLHSSGCYLYGAYVAPHHGNRADGIRLCELQAVCHRRDTFLQLYSDGEFLEHTRQCPSEHMLGVDVRCNK